MPFTRYPDNLRLMPILHRNRKADGDACHVLNRSAGVCSVGQCGNGRVDGGAADCSKLEVCGDAVVDDGEACDAFATSEMRCHAFRQLLYSGSDCANRVLCVGAS
jgi:hypothetical protein